MSDSQAPREEGLDRGVEGASDTQGAANADAEAALGALDGSATHLRALRELGAGEVLRDAAGDDWMVHAPDSTQNARRRKVSFD